MGHLLFLLYINDPENCLENIIPYMHADDTFSDLITDLKNELENISNWMKMNKLSLNASKSECMVVGHRRK